MVSRSSDLAPLQLLIIHRVMSSCYLSSWIQKKHDNRHVYLKNGFHPNLLVPQGLKECDYFNKFHERGKTFEQYTHEFPGILPSDQPPVGKCQMAVSALNGYPFVRSEASPNYLAHPYAAARAFAHLPDARIVVMLRGMLLLLFFGAVRCGAVVPY